MNSEHSKLQHPERSDLEMRDQTGARMIEYPTVEAMLRYDAGQVTVPESLPERVRESVAREPKPARSWWRRWFCRE